MLELLLDFLMNLEQFDILSYIVGLGMTLAIKLSLIGLILKLVVESIRANRLRR